MSSGSGLQVPAVRSTRRILRVQLMVGLPSRLRRVAELLRPALHAVEPGPVGVHVGDRGSRARRDAGGIPEAQVALLRLARALHVIDRPERARDRAHLAADAHRLEHDLRARREVDLDGLHRAGAQAPRLVALRAGVGDLLPGAVELEHLDARLRRIEDAVVLVAASELALLAAGALVRVDVE